VGVEVSGPESGFGVGEVEVPHALEGRTESELAHLGGGGSEPVASCGQGAGVVLAQGVVGGHAQACVGAQDVVDGLDGRDLAAGEDVLVDPGVAAARAGEGRAEGVVVVIGDLPVGD
jgi:hypothetical protein